MSYKLDYEYEPLPSIIHELYHYTPYNTMHKILTERGISLRFTRSDCFKDKLEGMHVMNVYDKAIRDLHNENAISNEHYEIFRSVSLYDKHLFVSGISSNGQMILASSDFSVFVFCFSLDNDSEYLWEEYMKNDAMRGYSLHFSRSDLDNAMPNYSVGAHFKMMQVLYSGDAGYSFIKQKMLEMYSTFPEEMRSRDNIEAYARILLSKVQFGIKDKSFSKENEVRAVLYISDTYFPQNGNEFLSPADQSMHMYMKIPNKKALWGITPSPNLREEPNCIDQAFQQLREYGYRFRSR